MTAPTKLQTVAEAAADWMRLLRDATNQEHEIAMLDTILAALAPPSGEGVDHVQVFEVADSERGDFHSNQCAWSSIGVYLPIGTKLYLHASPPATVDVGAGKEALAIIDKWMESYDHMGTGTSADARMSEREWEEDRAKLAALIGKEA